MSAPHGVAQRRGRLLRFGTGAAWSAHQLGLAAVGSTGAVAYLVALDRAAGGFDPIFWALAVTPALLTKLNGSGVPLAFWTLMLFGWVHLTPAGSFSWWAVLGAGGVALGHASAALSAAAPPSASFPSHTLRRWLRLVLVALGSAVGVGLAAGLLRDRVDGLGAVAQLLGLVALTVGVWLLRNSPPEAAN